MKIIEYFKGFSKPLASFQNIRDTFYDPRGNGKRRHMGIDMRDAKNAEIYAVKDGTISAIGYDSVAGNYVRIKHADGFETSSVHMVKKTTFLNVGAHIKAGQLIGHVGNTGNSVANHLHLGLKKDGKWINPYPYLRSAYHTVPVAYYEKSNGMRRGEHVRYLQQLLNKAGFSVAEDSVFGKDTEKAVLAFQKEKGLFIDGVVGEKSWQVLMANTTAQPEPAAPKEDEKSVANLSRLLKLPQGESIRTLQQALNQAGHIVIVDGIFGSKTIEAVRKFQKNANIAVDGIVGKDTATALGMQTPTSIIQLQRGADVKKVQEALKEKGFDCGSIDGIYGNQSYVAVKTFQKRRGLSEDGVVGKRAVEALGGLWQGV